MMAIVWSGFLQWWSSLILFFWSDDQGHILFSGLEAIFRFCFLQWQPSLDLIFWNHGHHHIIRLSGMTMECNSVFWNDGHLWINFSGIVTMMFSCVLEPRLSLVHVFSNVNHHCILYSTIPPIVGFWPCFCLPSFFYEYRYLRYS